MHYLQLNGADITLSETQILVRVSLHQTTSFQQQTTNPSFYQTCHLELHRISPVRHYLSEGFDGLIN